MIERWERIEVVDMAECCVLRDRLETFLLGARPAPNGEAKSAGSRFCSTFLLLGENCADLSDVGVPIREPGRDTIRGGSMKP
jgi:hypothetical protein